MTDTQTAKRVPAFASDLGAGWQAWGTTWICQIVCTESVHLASACSCGDRHPSRTQARPSVSPNQRTAQSGIDTVNHSTDSTFAW